ncbi:MAG: response regulator [Candidatus Magnetomorum sp.]|nr:response regulator [Candidatus Magnetomorum sp.]
MSMFVPHDFVSFNIFIISILICTLFFIISNMKKRKKANSALEEMKDHLENMVAERTRELTLSNQQLQEEIVKRERAQEALRRAKETAEAANRAKSDFLANMSHELRTPLNAILGFSKLMEHNSDAAELQREYLGIINRSGEHLLELINDVLEMSKIEAGQIKLNLSSFNLHHTIKGIEDMIRGRAEKKGLTFKVDCLNIPHFIKTDVSKFRQVLINLLSNAIKFTDSGAIHLKVSGKEFHTGIDFAPQILEVEIEDTGIGIAKKEMHAIFDSFSRISHDKYGMEGAGLGLAISKKLIELMGGKISIESAEQFGSIFRFTIHYQQASQMESMQLSHQNVVISVNKNWKHIKILVVEDKWENRLLLKRLLLRVGFQVIEAENGQEAIQEFQKHQPGLIFMDIRMQLMSGIEATAKIRSLPHGKKVKIVAITAHAFEEFREDILAVGCDDFIRKPYRESEIFDSIQKLLGVTFVTEKRYYTNHTKHLTVSPAVELQKDDVSVLPKIIRKRIKTMAVNLDASRFETLVEEIRQEYPEIAGKLFELSRQFRYDHILNCLTKEDEHV